MFRLYPGRSLVPNSPIPLKTEVILPTINLMTDTKIVYTRSPRSIQTLFSRLRWKATNYMNYADFSIVPYSIINKNEKWLLWSLHYQINLQRRG